MQHFKRAYVEITNMCNLRCSFCKKSRRAPREMSPQEFAHVLAQLRPFVQQVYLHVLGEPLFHSALQEVLHEAKKAQMPVNITTNGTLLRQKGAVLLASSALRKVSISLHSFEQKSDLGLREYVGEAVDFARAAACQGILCELRVWDQSKETAQKNEQLRLLLEELLGLQLPSFTQMSGGITLAPNLFLGLSQPFEWPALSLPPLDEKAFCYGLRTQVAVLSGGTVVPCCLDADGEIELGNLFYSSMEQILRSKRATDFYEGFSARKANEPLCRHCSYARRF